MGYDIMNFIGEIDEDFECGICHMVMENPMQLPCEHIFCHECIKGWLTVIGYCPEDCGSMKLRDLRAVDEHFIERMNEMEMICDFQPEGCQTIVTLEHRREHLANCTFNTYRNIIWDNDELSSVRNLPHPPNWQFVENISIDDPHILETETDDDRENHQSAFTQSFHSLEPGHSYFKIQILNLKYRFESITIGLNCKNPDSESDNEPGWNAGFMACNSLGELWFDKKRKYIGPKWKCGDIIKCGVKFSTNYESNGGVVKIYFLVNQRMIMEKIIKMPSGGFFPTLAMSATGTKVRYLKN